MSEEAFNQLFPKEKKPEKPSTPSPTISQPEPVPTQPTPSFFSFDQPKTDVIQPQPKPEPTPKVEESVTQPETPAKVEPQPSSTVSTQMFSFDSSLQPQTTEPTSTPTSTEQPATTQTNEDFFTQMKQSVPETDEDDKIEFDEKDLKPIPSDQYVGKDKMIFGYKGSGKTVLALSELLEGKTYCCLSFDNQTKVVRDTIFGIGDDVCPVWDGMMFHNETNEKTKVESSEKAIKYVLAVLNGPIAEFKPDIIFIDGTEILLNVCEMYMRKRNRLGMVEGFKNRSLWKQRNMYLDQIYRTANKIAKEGVTCTAYIDIREVTTAAGEIKIEEPKWAGDIKTKSRIVIKVGSVEAEDNDSFYASVISSKLPEIPTQPKKLVGVCYRNGTFRVDGMKVLRRENLQPNKGGEKL